MAFRSNFKVDDNGDCCEVCGKDTNEIVLTLSGGTQKDGDRYVVFIHNSCLQRKIDKVLG